MGVLTIRRIDDQVKERIQRQAERNGRSMEHEVREILREAMDRPVQGGALVARIASLLAKIESIPELRRTAPVKSRINRKGRKTSKAKG